VLANTKNKELSEQMETVVKELCNPFEELYHWCKGEIYDLQAM